MRLMLISAFAVAFAGTAWAQARPVPIPFAPAANSTWQVTEVRTRVERGEGADRTRTITTRGTLTVSAFSGELFDTNWVVNQIDAGGRVITNEPQLFVGLDMRLALDTTGAPASVGDWPQLRRSIFETVEDMTPEAERTEEWRRGLVAFENTMSQWAPSHAAQVLVPGIAVMSICQGTEMNVGEPITATSQLPNSLGGPPLTAMESLTLDSVDRAAGIARLRYTRALDPELATVAIRETLVGLARQSGRPIEEIERTFAGMTMTHDTRAECVVDLATGVTRSVAHEVVVTMGPEYRSDRREITVTAR